MPRLFAAIVVQDLEELAASGLSGNSADGTGVNPIRFRLFRERRQGRLEGETSARVAEKVVLNAMLILENFVKPVRSHCHVLPFHGKVPLRGMMGVDSRQI